ncbi:MAG: CBS domain-containing protein [Halioglobus sp.]|nr:CBS domain-containing protein [Halioglobus sp.]
MLTVAEIMTREPYTLGPDDSLASARQMMAVHHIRHIPVVSADGSLIGIVSQRDVLAAEDSSVLSDATKDTDNRDQYVALSSIMTTPVQTVDERASLRGTALHLQKTKLGCLPVLRQGALIGIITDSDFVDIAINLMEQLEHAEPDDYDFDEGDAFD